MILLPPPVELTFSQMEPKPYVAYLPFLIKYDRLRVRTVCGDRVVNIASPPETARFSGQKLTDADQPYGSDLYGPTKKVCLGTRVHARSGDEGSNANVGLWVQDDDEYEWLRSFMTVETFKALLRDDYDPKYILERF